MNVFFSSPWVPVEWIKAHGFEPRGVWSAKNLWPDSLPLSAGVCAYAEAVVCLAEAQADAAVIFTTTCDQLRRGFDALAVAARSRAFLFNLPATWQSPAARRIYRSEVERLGQFLRDLGGRAPLPQALEQEMARYGDARSRLIDAAPSCSARGFAEAVARFHWDGSIHLPARSAMPPADGIPLAIVGGPLSAPHWNLLEVIEAMGGRVVLNATETGERSLWPAFGRRGSSLEPGRADLPVGLDARQRVPTRSCERARIENDVATAEDPFEVLVRGYFENIVDVFQKPNTRLYSWLEDRLAARRVRGIVLWQFTGCDLWGAEAQTLRETFGLPVLVLEADEAQSCSPRDVNRIQAFVETLR